MSSNPYIVILKRHKAYIFALSALVARGPMAMYGFGLFMMMTQLSTSPTLGIYLSSCFYLGVAFFSPQVAKLVDKYGQSLVIKWIVLINTIALIAILICIKFTLPLWMLYAAVIVLSVLPSVGSLSRARWINLYQDKAELNTAMALEAMLDEIIYLIGTPLAILLSTLIFPSATLIVAWLMLFFGLLIFISHKQTEPNVKADLTANYKNIFALLLQLPIASLVIFALLLGISFGVIEVMMVKFAQYKDSTVGMGGVMLFLFSVGSIIGGYVFGIRKSSLPLLKQFICWAFFYSLVCISLWFVPSVLIMCIVAVFGGVSIAPTITLSLSLVNISVAQSNITEGISWLSSAINLGISIGVGLVGIVIGWQNYGVGYAFSISFITGWLMLIAALLVYLIINRKLAIKKVS